MKKKRKIKIIDVAKFRSGPKMTHEKLKTFKGGSKKVKYRRGWEVSSSPLLFYLFNIVYD